MPVHEDIKLGKPSRDRLIANYQQTIRNLGAAGIKVICYNFMPVFDWTRTSMAKLLPDGSTTLTFDTKQVDAIDVSKGISLPGWDASYKAEELKDLLAEYSKVGEEKLWENLSYFLRAIVPVAAESGIKMAIHPDDPPRPIFGLPRIVKNRDDLDRLLRIVDSPANGLTLCSGSLGAGPQNNVEALVREFGGAGGASTSRICATSRSAPMAISRRRRTNPIAGLWTWRRSSRPITMSATRVMRGPTMAA